MGNLVHGIGQLLGGTPNNAGFQAVGGANQQQAGTAYNQTQQGIAAQQALMQALANQGGLQNQANVYNQIQGVANGTGPNPAQAMLNQATGQNVQNQAALMAGQRGAGANAGLLARQAAQQGAGLQQQAVGQGASMQAAQQLGALGQLGGLANQQVANQMGATQGFNQATQGQQQNVLGALGQQNATNEQIAASNAQRNASAIGGLGGGIGSAIGFLGDKFLAEGGMVPNPKVGAVEPSKRFSGDLEPHVEHMAKIYHPHMFSEGGQVQDQDQNQKLQYGGGTQQEKQQRAQQAQQGFMKAAQDNPISNAIAWAQSKMAHGGKVPAMVSPGEVYLTPEKAKEVAKDGKNPIKEGEKIPGKAKVKGDSYSNDTVPKKLEAGGVVIPKSIMESDDPAGNAHAFVTKLMEKSKEHGDFKEALKTAMTKRKS